MVSWTGKAVPVEKKRWKKGKKEKRKESSSIPPSTELSSLVLSCRKGGGGRCLGGMRLSCLVLSCLVLSFVCVSSCLLSSVLYRLVLSSVLSVFGLVFCLGSFVFTPCVLLWTFYSELSCFAYTNLRVVLCSSSQGLMCVYYLLLFLICPLDFLICDYVLLSVIWFS